MNDIEKRPGIELQDRPFLLSADAMSVTTSSNWPPVETSTEDQDQAVSFDPQLETALQVALASSRVYRRAWKEGDDLSLISGATRATPWSLLSGLSLAEVSAVSIIALPVFARLICNSNHCHFAGFTQHAGEMSNERHAENTVPADWHDVFRACGLVCSYDDWLPKPLEMGASFWSTNFSSGFDTFCVLMIYQLPLPSYPKSDQIVVPSRSLPLKKALQRFIDRLEATSRRLYLIDDTMRTSPKRVQLGWRLRYRGKTEEVLRRELHGVWNHALAICLYLTWCQTHSEEGMDNGFHIKIAKSYRAVEWYQKKDKLVLIFGEEALRSLTESESHRIFADTQFSNGLGAVSQKARRLSAS